MQEPFPIYSSHGSLMILTGLFARRFEHQPELPGKKNLKLFYLIKRIPRGSASGYRGKFENLKVFIRFEKA